MAMPHLVCPNPDAWDRVYQRLSALATDRRMGPPPPRPLILGGWVFTNDVEKKRRWEETVAWAQARGLESEVRVAPEEMYVVDQLSSRPVSCSDDAASGS